MKYEKWRERGHPIAALASNLTDDVSDGPQSFLQLCEIARAVYGATPGEVCEAIALAYLCKQIVPDAGAWRASHKGDFEFTVERRELDRGTLGRR
jgi:hypothetical protein